MTLISAGISTGGAPDKAVHYYPGDNRGTPGLVTDYAGDADFTRHGTTWVQNQQLAGRYGLQFDGVDDYCDGTPQRPSAFTWIIRAKIAPNPPNGILTCYGYDYQPSIAYSSGKWNFYGRATFLDIPDPTHDVFRILVFRGDASQADATVYDADLNVIGSKTMSGGSGYDGQTAYLGGKNGEWKGVIDPNLVIADSKLSDTEVDTILQYYF